MLTLQIDNQTLEFREEHLFHSVRIPWSCLHRERGMQRHISRAMSELKNERMVALRADGQTLTLFGVTYQDVRFSVTQPTASGQVHAAVFASREGYNSEGLTPSAARRLRAAGEQAAIRYYQEHFERLHRLAAQQFLQEAERKIETLCGQLQGMRDVLQRVAWEWDYVPVEEARKQIES
ncbi:MAG: hypothetical protein KDD02_00905 [Phaeodactylibacter sp.]|nr:hypothetical protein [Phaeodactylibacter sp.]MCB9302600.1 hypothetical protein [Lewinellaceae bacterium]